ncbi:MAG TPA: choice-of-anchor D domain-containing protein [Herpetosiphonaceae bacterium]
MPRSRANHQHPRSLIRLLAALALAALVGLPQAMARPASPDGSLTVNILADGMTEDNKCSLREAIQAANSDQAVNTGGGQADCPAGSGADTIQFSVSGSITLNNEIFVNSIIAMTGPIAISGNDASRLLRVTSQGNLSLANMTLSKGNGNSAAGGAILIEGGTLNLAGVSFDSNKAPGAGGAISNASGTLNIVGSNFVANESQANGGAIHSSGPGQSLRVGGTNFNGNKAKWSGGAIYTASQQAEIVDVLMAGNIASAENDFSGGGGIYTAENTTLSVLRTSFTGNLAPGGDGGGLYSAINATSIITDTSFNGNIAGELGDQLGGAIYNQENLRVTRATFLNNLATGSGGAIANDRGGAAIIANVSFTANKAVNGSGGALANLNTQQGSSIPSLATVRSGTFSGNAADAGSALHSPSPSQLTIGNTIVDSGEGPNCAAGINLASLGHNLDRAATCGFSQPGDLSNADPKLDSPFFNGGPIVSLLTQKLLPGSAALDAGNAAQCAAAPISNEDQRGKPRPKDGDGNGSAICDIGAFENDTVAAGFGSTPLQPGPIDFGTAVVNSSIDASLTVFETGNHTLQLGSPQLGGAHAANFSLLTPFPISIADGGQPVEIGLRCTPSALGARTATLAFASNDPAKPNVAFNLTCVGANAPTPGYGSTPAAPGPLSFGTVTLGATKIVPIVVEETGSATLLVNGPVLAGSNPGDFQVNPNLSLSIANGAAPQNVPVTCAPAGLGIRTATLTLNTNDPTKPTVSYNLSCAGASPPDPVLAPGTPATQGGNMFEAVVSPDGNQIYVTTLAGNSLHAMNRNPTTGAPTFSSTYANVLANLYGVALSPNGDYVYVSGGSGAAGAVRVYRHGSGTALTFVEDKINGTGGVTGLGGAKGLVVSPDGKSVYAVSDGDNGLVAFRRNTADGRLTFVEAERHGVGGVTGLDGAREISISPDGAHLYVTSYLGPAGNGGTVAVFRRNPADSRLTFVTTYADGAGGVNELDGAYDVTVSPDGAFVYAVSCWDRAVTAFRRNAADGRLTVAATYKEGVGGVSGLQCASGVAINPAGTQLYVASFTPGTLAVFRRTPADGLLQFAEAHVDGQPGVANLNGARRVAPSPDGKHVYVTAYVDNALNTFSQAQPIPAIERLEPASVTAGGAGFTLIVRGEDFVQNSVVRWNGANRTTTFVSASELRATISAADIAAVGSRPVTVFNPAPGGGASNAVSLPINTPNANPLPAIEQLGPSAAAAGGPAFTLDVVGTGFVAGSKVRWNGQDRPTTFVSGSQLKATIAAADLTQPGAMGVTVFTPAPGGGTSNAATFTVNAPGENPVPAITQITPNRAVAYGGGSNDLTIRVQGTQFTEDSVVYWDGEARPTDFVSATELRVVASAADLAEAGSLVVTVRTPAPGGGQSNGENFTVFGHVRYIPVVTR